MIWPKDVPLGPAAVSFRDWLVAEATTAEDAVER